MTMGAAPVPQNVRRNTRKGRRKKSIRKGRKKRKRRKNESISLPSQMRVQTRTDRTLTMQHSRLRSNTGQRTEGRGIREDEEGATPRRRPSGVTRVTHPPSSADVTTVAGAVSSQVLIREWLISGRKALVDPPPC